jgi:hypothetical protein
MTGIEAGKTWSRIGPQVAPTSASASGVWQIQEASEYIGAETWPVPAGPVVLLGETHSLGSVATYTFGSIPQTYKALELRGWLAVSTTAINPFQVNFNTIGTNDLYDSHIQKAGSTNGVPVLASAGGSQNAMRPMYSFTVQNDASQPIPFRVFIPNYAKTDKQKCISWWSSATNYTQYDYANKAFAIGVYNFQRTEAISSITVTGSSNFQSWNDAIGLALYGWGG